MYPLAESSRRDMQCKPTSPTSNEVSPTKNKDATPKVNSTRQIAKAHADLPRNALSKCLVHGYGHAIMLDAPKVPDSNLR